MATEVFEAANAINTQMPMAKTVVDRDSRLSCPKVVIKLPSSERQSSSACVARTSTADTRDSFEKARAGQVARHAYRRTAGVGRSAHAGGEDSSPIGLAGKEFGCGAAWGCGLDRTPVHRRAAHLAARPTVDQRGRGARSRARPQ
jgi:hypothetical protein